ncbi:hypothetical protein [Oceanisphaera pacifica]|nr:hypothetical protein [Oceanisphaera pacifica]
MSAAPSRSSLKHNNLVTPLMGSHLRESPAWIPVWEQAIHLLY